MLARLWKLPPSMMTLIDLPLMPALVWKMLHLWSSQAWGCVVNTLVTTRDGLASWSHRSSCSSNLAASYVIATWCKASYSPSLMDMVSPFSSVNMVLVLIHSKELWPLPPHLKHTILLELVASLGAMVVFTCCFEVFFGGTLELANGGLPIVVALALALREAKYVLVFSFFCSSILTWRSALVAWCSNSVMFLYG